jgi:hypothetical protein
MINTQTLYSQLSSGFSAFGLKNARKGDLLDYPFIYPECSKPSSAAVPFFHQIRKRKRANVKTRRRLGRFVVTHATALVMMNIDKAKGNGCQCRSCQDLARVDVTALGPGERPSAGAVVVAAQNATCNR